MRRAIARRLTESKATVPHFYLTAQCRVDALLALRTQLNADLDDKLSVNDFVVKAVAGALADVPQMNATWTDDAMLVHHQADVAIAVALEDGLVTPVVRDAGGRSVGDISRTVKDLVDRARSGSLRQAELEGGAFTISNLGMYGTEQFAAIINPPHAGILAVGAATQRPVAVDGRLEVGTVMTVTLSGDHRVADGATGARWLAAFVRRVEHPMLALV
jgi:pyruvate dehydrogenase E2 component (dihydrolipoamide acetyltransferase)